MKMKAGSVAGQKPDWQTRLTALKDLPFLISFAWKKSPLLLTASVFVRFLRSGVPVANLWIAKHLIDAIVRVSIRKTGSEALVWKLLAAQATVAIASDLLGRVSSLSEGLLMDEVSGGTSLLVMEHTITLDLASRENPLFQEMLDRTRKSGVGRSNLIRGILNSQQDVLSFTWMCLGIGLASPWLLLLLLVTLVPSFMGELELSATEFAVMLRRTPQRRMLDYLQTIVSGPSTGKEERLFEFGPHLISRYKRLFDSIIRENTKVALRRSWISSLLSFLANVGYFAGFIFVLRNTVQNGMSLGSFLFLTRGMNIARTHFKRIIESCGEISDGSLMLGGLIGILRVQPMETGITRNCSVPKPIRDGIRFVDVGFKYPDSEKWILRNVCFTLGANEKLALVGDNGAGKSTVAKLLAGLYTPTEGQILLDGVDLQHYDRQDLLRNTSAIYQDYIRFDLSMRDNIGLGNYECIHDEDLLKLATEGGLAKGLLKNVGGDYDQMLGRRFVGGIELSGGQWQRLALARAYTRKAQIWILDEPTAAIDVRAEAEWFKRFSVLSEGGLALLISHRFSTVRLADKIVVLEDGRVKEMGTHDELTRLGGNYAKMFHLQAIHFK